MADIAGEKQRFEDIFRGDEDLEIKSDKENFFQKRKNLTAYRRKGLWMSL